jgi:molybdopterin-guanine dinucleotide biosynthesis protein A
MGRAKAELEFGTATLLERMVAELRQSFPEIVLVTSPAGLAKEQRLGEVRMVRDEREYEGPLPALALGLTAIRNDYAFACGCDAPFLRSDLASSLCAMLEHYDAVMPEIAGLVQPLHAVYRKRCIAAINSMIAQGEARLAQIVEAVSVRRVGEQELRAIDPHLLSFINVNTPQDYERALRLVSATN